MMLQTSWEILVDLGNGKSYAHMLHVGGFSGSSTCGLSVVDCWLALTDRLLTPKCSFATLQVTMVREGFPEFLNFNCSFLELNRFICNKQSVLTVHCKLHVS